MASKKYVTVYGKNFSKLYVIEELFKRYVTGSGGSRKGGYVSLKTGSDSVITKITLMVNENKIGTVKVFNSRDSQFDFEESL